MQSKYSLAAICSLFLLLFFYLFCHLLTWYSAGTASPHVVQEIVVWASSRREGEANVRMSSLEKDRCYD